MVGRRTDTRSRVREVAMDLFSRQGYEATSLRHIAERLGVTKAALYYHFRTKEDIVVSVCDDFRTAVDEILEWAHAEPPGPATADGILARYATLMHESGTEIVGFMIESQAAFRSLEIGSVLRHQFVALADAAAAHDPDPVTVFAARQALLAVSWSVTMTGDLDLDNDRRCAEALEIARGILSRGDTTSRSPTRT